MASFRRDDDRHPLMMLSTGAAERAQAIWCERFFRRAKSQHVEIQIFVRKAEAKIPSLCRCSTYLPRGSYLDSGRHGGRTDGRRRRRNVVIEPIQQCVAMFCFVRIYA